MKNPLVQDLFNICKALIRQEDQSSVSARARVWGLQDPISMEKS
jgi:hypothetical protein